MDEGKSAEMCCPGCGQKMESGFMQVYSKLLFDKKRVSSLLFQNPEICISPLSHDLLSNELCFTAWFCPDCGYILFDAKDPRAGKGKNLRNTVLDAIDRFLEPSDKEQKSGE